jgi:hypothetical protein
MRLLLGNWATMTASPTAPALPAARLTAQPPDHRNDCANVNFMITYTYQTTFNEPVINPPSCTCVRLVPQRAGGGADVGEGTNQRQRGNWGAGGGGKVLVPDHVQ